MFTLFISFFAFSGFAQQNIDEKDGVSYTYTLTKVKEDAKFIYYSALVKAVNKNGFDVFYQGPKNKTNPFFATIEESNSGTSFYFEGTLSRLQLGDIPLYYLKPNASFSSTKEFKIKKDTNPLFKLDYVNTLDQISSLK